MPNRHGSHARPPRRACANDIRPAEGPRSPAPSAALLAALAALALVMSGCSSGPQTNPPDGRANPDYPQGSDDLGGPLASASGAGFSFTVGDGNPQGAARNVRVATSVQPLAADVTAALLARLPAIDKSDADEKDFALRPATQPPPKTGDVVQTPFPPPEAPDAATPTTSTDPAKVLRYQPQGDVPVAPRISVTFDQPMVPLTSHDTLAKGDVPVELSPTIEGNWRWVGTKTLFFDPTGRAPMATHYTARVPAGVKDAQGRPLAKGVEWTFSTPPPRLVSSSPGGSSVDTAPTFVLVFDQRVDADAVRSTLKVTASGKDITIRALTDKERADLPQAKDKDIEGRWVAFRAAEKLPTDSSVSVTVPKGTPSAEGPRLTEQAQSYSFKTYGPFVIREHRCGWRDCRPGMPWGISFSNSIDEDAFDPQMVSVTPTVEGLEAEISGSMIQLRGLTRGRTTYTVKIASALKDVYGQLLTGKDTVEFEVGEAPRTMGAPDSGFVVLDPTAKKQRFSIFTVNYEEVDVALYKVAPSDYGAYIEFVQKRHHRDGPTKPPGQRVFEKRTATQGAADQLTELPIDLGPALANGLGQVILVAKPVGAEDEYQERNQTVIAWVQSTRIGLDAFVDSEELIGWATSLADGQSLPGVELTLEPQGTKATTGAGGLGTITLPDSASDAQMLIARQGEDVAFLPDASYYWSRGGQWHKQGQTDQIRWMVFDDRRLYRPSEKVSVKGILRVIEAGEKGDVAPLPAGFLTEVQYAVRDSRNNEIGKGTARVSPHGTFDLSFTLPDTPNLGWANVTFTTGTSRFANAQHQHGFQIQEFRRPEFEVAASTSEGPHLVGGEATMTVKASYFAGGPLPGAEVNWHVSSNEGRFTPPNQDDFEFGRWVPWWGYHGRDGGELSTSRSHQGVTDASGSHSIALAFEAVDPPLPVSITAQATVTDVNRQAWTATSSMLVHPGSHYVGLRSEKRFVEAGQTIFVDAIVANIDGKRLTGQAVAVEMVRLDWKRHKGDWVQIEADKVTCDVTSAAEPVRCELKPAKGGTHRVRAVVRDERQRPNLTEMTVWVAGGKQPPSKKLEQERVELIPERQDWKVGEVAKVLVQAPFSPAEGVMHVQRDGMVTTKAFSMKGPSHTLEIPVEEWMIPNFYVMVSLNGAAERVGSDGKPLPGDVAKRPAYAVGSIGLRVPPVLRTLTLAVKPAAERLSPAEETSVTVSVADSDGRPVGGTEVTLIAVDESVLAMTGYRIPSPLDVFYSSRGDGTRTRHLREHVLLASLQDLLAQANQKMEESAEAEDSKVMEGAAPPSPTAAVSRMAADKDASGADGGEDAPIAVRKNFDPLAVFAPTAMTDESGNATVTFKLPDNLTRYRVMVVATARENHFGSGEATITARLPLMVRMSPPRFLNFGDRFELPIVLQNQTDEAMDVRVALRATNADITAGQGRMVTVPANDRVEVRFPASAAKPGTARFQAGASFGSYADAAEVALPVWTPATTEAFATYGEIDQGAALQPVRAPDDAVTAFGGLDVQVSSTQLQALTDAVVYLTNYPFECSEQVASRVVSIAALRDVLSAFEAPGLPSAEALLAAVKRDMDLLRGMQNYDGGWGFWRRGEVSWPFLSAHVAHALARAKVKGFEVPQQLLNDAMGYLRDIEQHIARFEAARSWTISPEVKRALRAYALYTLNWLDERDADKARRILTEAGGVTKTGLETLGWLYPVLSGAKGFEGEIAEIRKHLNNQVSETAAGAHFVTSYSDGAHLLLHSNRRVDGILLEGLIIDQPKSDLIPKLVRGLLAHRTKGRWANTQESAWVLLGLDKYFNVFEATTPDFVARVWLGDQFAGQHAFKGRTTETHHVHVPMAWLAEREGDQPLVVGKQGAGRLYYRLGMTYAPKSLKLAPADHGFYVERTYLPIDHVDDVTRDADGRWIVKAGAKVRVKVTMVAQDRRYHVALVDPMPAGFEALNPELLGAESVPVEPDDEDGPGLGGRAYWRWWGPWYEHQNLRDERAEAFSALLWDGVYTYSYVARATTPGEFIVPPSKAEEMYHPETFGRSATDYVTVTAAD